MPYVTYPVIQVLFFACLGKHVNKVVVVPVVVSVKWGWLRCWWYWWRGWCSCWCCGRVVTLVVVVLAEVVVVLAVVHVLVVPVERS